MNSLKEIESVLKSIVEDVCENKFGFSIYEQDENNKKSKNILVSAEILFDKDIAIKNDSGKNYFCNPVPDFPQNNFSSKSNDPQQISDKLISLNKNLNFSSDFKEKQIRDFEMSALKANEKTESKVLANDSFDTENEKNTDNESSATSSEDLLSQEIDKAFVKYEAMYEKKDKQVKDVSVQTNFNFNTVSTSICGCNQKTFKPEINNPKYFGSILYIPGEKELDSNFQNPEELSTSTDEKIKEEEINFAWKPPPKRIRLGLSKQIKPKPIFNKIF